MTTGRSALIAIASLALMIGGAVHAQETARTDLRQEAVIRIDPVALIKKASTNYKGSFKISEQAAVAQMDAMLTEQYSARGRISTEKDANLKSLYYQAASLLLNGYPIAGGTIVSVARNERRFAQSPAGQGMASFVDAMLQPSDEDADLLEMQERTEKSRAAYKSMRPELRFYADLWVVGHIYLDDIAVNAGKSGVEAMKPTPDERKMIRNALALGAGREKK